MVFFEIIGLKFLIENTNNREGENNRPNASILKNNYILEFFLIAAITSSLVNPVVLTSGSAAFSVSG